jgi:methionyl-tRNA formyltransferase
VRLVFCGTPQFAVPTLEELHGAGHEIALVVSQPDRPRGRGMEVQPTPVKQKALELGLKIAQPEKIKTNDEFRAQLETIKPEAIIVVAYGRIIPEWMLKLPPHGNLNLHASLLPKYRGAAPIQWAIANGETVSGNTTMRIDAGLDTGDILLQEELAITDTDTALTYSPKLAASGAVLMATTVRALGDGTLGSRPQEHDKATHAPLLTKEDGKIDFHQTARVVYDRFRGFQPWPGAWTIFRGKQLTITQAKSSRECVTAHPGTVVLLPVGMFVACGEDTSLEVLEVQPEGKKKMPARDFANGYSPDGQRLG